MRCLHPIEVPYYPNMSYKRFIRLYPNCEYYKLVPCGKCPECQIRLKNNWSFRLLHQMEVSSNNYFVTLTYDDNNIPTSDLGYCSLERAHLERFIKQFRNDCQSEYIKDLKKLSSKEKAKIRCPMKYFAIGDYGEQTFRPHYHVIVYNSPFDRQKLLNYITDNWPYGQINQVDNLIGQQCNYITRYLVKVAYNEDELKQYGVEPTFRLMSRGIGTSFADEIRDHEFFDLNRRAYHKGKGLYGLPSYLKQKIIAKHFDNDKVKIRRYNRNEYTKYLRNDKYRGYPKYMVNNNSRQLDEDIANHDSILINRQQK